MEGNKNDTTVKTLCYSSNNDDYTNHRLENIDSTFSMHEQIGYIYENVCQRKLIEKLYMAVEVLQYANMSRAMEETLILLQSRTLDYNDRLVKLEKLLDKLEDKARSYQSKLLIKNGLQGFTSNFIEVEVSPESTSSITIIQ